MPHPKTSNDPTFTDNQLPEPIKVIRIKKQPPEPWPIPEYDPMRINRHLAEARLPVGTTISAIGIWKLFMTDQVLETIVRNTNQYAEEHIDASIRQRPWKPVTLRELYAFIAVQVYMGIHTETDIEDYWNTHPSKPLHPAIAKHIGKTRFEQIDRYFHISTPKPPSQNETTFEKIEPLSNHLLERCLQLYKAPTDLAVDEVMVRFTGRSHDVVKLPGKPIPEGFKIWCIASEGFIIQWMFHTKKKQKGPIGLDMQWTKKPYSLSKTEAVVLTLAQKVHFQGGNNYIIWLDNLFTTTKVLSALRTYGYGGAGTVRKSEGRGLDDKLVELKKDYSDSIEWGKYYAVVDKDNILQFGWKDQGFVTFMSTVSHSATVVQRLRRRPAATATSAMTSRRVFGDDTTKTLPIPEAIDEYNHHMNGPDQADQLRSYYYTQRIH